MAAVLAERDAEPLRRACWRGTPTVRAVRRAFVSFGCCGVTDPLDDLRRARPAGRRADVTELVGRGAGRVAASRSHEPARTACSRRRRRAPRVRGARSATTCSTSAPLAAADGLDGGHVFEPPALNAVPARWAGRRGRPCGRGWSSCSTDERTADTRRAAPGRRSPRSRCTCRSRSPTTSTSTPREHHAENVGAHLPARRRRRCRRTGSTCRSATTAAPARSSSPAPTSCGRAGSAGRRGRRPPTFGPSVRLDIEAEVGFVVGVPSPQGTPVPATDFRRARVRRRACSTTGAARDIQAWEYVPLGPFLGKSFATSVSPWVMPLDALRRGPGARPAAGSRRRCPTCATPSRWGLDLALEVRLERHGGLAAAVRRHVLDAGPAARAPDRQRRLAADRRPVRLRHGLAAPTRRSAARSSSCPGTVPSR